MARKKQTTLVLFPEILSVTRKLSDEQFGVLMRAAFSYRLNGEVYSGNDVAVDVAFQFVSNQIDRYMENCAINARNASSNNSECSEMQRNAAECPQNTPPLHSYPYPYPKSNKREADKPPKPAPFSPPSVDDVREYCNERGYTTIDPERFVNHYAAIQWKVGQSVITDWRAKVDNWHRDDVSRSNSTISMPTYGGEENWSL